MNKIRKFVLTTVVAPVAAVAFAASPAMAATPHPLAPFPACGNHFMLSRAGNTVHIIANDLGAFFNGYMLVWPAANGKSFGPFNASPNGGAAFNIDTGSSAKTTVAISLTDSGNELTLCADDYYV